MFIFYQWSFLLVVSLFVLELHVNRLRATQVKYHVHTWILLMFAIFVWPVSMLMFANYYMSFVFMDVVILKNFDLLMGDWVGL